MGRVKTRQSTTRTDRRSCGVGLDEHIAQIMTALARAGLGVACEEEYRALLVLAETARRVHGHADFDPREKAAAIVEDARQMVKRGTDRPSTPTYLAESGTIH